MSPRHTRYDMIFLGGGCAALSLLVRLLNSGQFSGYRFLVIDRDRKTANDRTWCFWERGVVISKKCYSDTGSNSIFLVIIFVLRYALRGIVTR